MSILDIIMLSSNICKKNGKITFEQRQKGMHCDLYTNIWTKNKQYYTKSDILKDSGRIFNASDETEDQGKIFAISGRFLPDPLYKKIGKYTSPTAPTTYIYIISKTINDQIYFKVGEGGKGESKGLGRLGDAQTYLIPGLEDAGYKVHFVFFFRKNLNINSIYIGQYIEQTVHKILRTYFQPINISYPNDKPSEWYLLSKKQDELFFIGFVFDIIGCYDHAQTKPFTIWKYNSNGRTNVSLLPGVVQRMRLNKTYEEIAEKLREFNLRKKHRAIGLIVDKNNTEIYAEQLNIIKRYFGFSVREDLRSKVFNITFDTCTFDLIDFRMHNAATVEKYSKYYAVLQPSKDTNLERAEAFFEKHKVAFILSDNADILLRLKDFLTLYKTYYVSNMSKWSLKSIYDFYNSDVYEDNIETVEPVTQQIPSWFYNTSVQLYWARKMTNDKDWKKHEDYSINDEEKSTLNQYEVYGYDEEDGVRLKRYQIDSGNKKIENSDEEVDALRVMKLMDVYKPAKIDKRVLQKKRTMLKSAQIKSENDEFVTYNAGDIIEIQDDYFLFFDVHGEPDGLPHKEWGKYKIDFIYKNTSYDEDFLNPWMEVTYYGKSRDTKYEIVANEYLYGKIRKVSGVQVVEPILRKGQVIHISKQNAKNVFSDNVWWKHDHYVVVSSIDRQNGEYKITTFAPFANTETISMDTLHTNVKDEPINDAILQDYKKGLLFKIMSNSKIEGHKPQIATSHDDLMKRRKPQYRILYDKDIGIDPLQGAALVKENMSTKVTAYWKTRKRSPRTKKQQTRKKIPTKSTLYEFETLNANLARAKENWADHHNVNIKNAKAQKSAYEYKVHNPDGNLEPFRVGDLFVLRERSKSLKKGYITNFYYDESKHAMTYGVFFSSDDNQPTGNVYPEYTSAELTDILREGNTIPFLANMDDKVFGKMRRRYAKLLD